jgi:hypothetical protein
MLIERRYKSPCIYEMAPNAIVKTIGTLLFTVSTLGGLSGLLAPLSGATIYPSDGSAVNVKALHKAALNGDTITLPAGTFTWSTPVTIWKAIKLQGAGSGRIIGTTKSSVAVGTGAKTFTTTRSRLPITAGQTLRIAKMPHPPGGGGSESYPPARGTYMEGRVTSYSGTTLVMDITTIAGSGTWTFWWIATQSSTTILNNYNNGAGNNNGATPLIKVSQSRAGSTEIAGIHFVANPTSSSTMVGLGTNAYIVPKTLIHDCWFSTGNGSGSAAIFAATNQGLVWNCSFDDTFSRAAAGFQFKWEDPIGQRSWNTNSTMGAADTNGATNFYVEDCDFRACGIADFDSAARVVFRHNILDNSSMSSHGADTGPIGSRHVEIYDNELIFDNFGDSDGSVTLPVEWFFWMRGGTGVITDNILPAISSISWGNKGNITFSVLNIKRNTGGYPCWTNYPAPHQVGQGYGPGAVSHSHYSGANYGRLNYHTYLEPVYIWGNSGTGGNRASLNAESDDPCGNNQLLTDYVQAGRDYKLEAKPGYVKYTYPHPLTTSRPPPPPTASSPQNVQQKKGKKSQ